MPESTEQSVFEKLAEPFMPEDLEWRVGQTNGNQEDLMGMALAYITARAVMQRLDDVLGPENWKDDYREGANGGVMCGLSVRLGSGEWVTKWDGAENTDIEAVKGGLSDAFKRAAVKWGIGRYLYEFPNIWCKCGKRGRSTILLERPAVPEWAYPKGYLGQKESGMITINRRPGNKGASSTVRNTAPAKAPAATSKAPAVQQKSADSDNALERAKAYPVPEGIPMAGKTLGAAMEDPRLGVSILRFLAGETTNRAGEKFAPTNSEQEKLTHAAKYLLGTLETATAA